MAIRAPDGANKGLLCLYILKKLMVTSTNRPTNRPTNRANIEQSAFSKAEICNYNLVDFFVGGSERNCKSYKTCNLTKSRQSELRAPTW